MCLNRRNPCIAAVKIYCKVSWTPLRNTIFVSLTRWSAFFNLQNIQIKRLATEMSPGQSVQRTCYQSKIMIHEKKKPRVTHFVWTKKPLLPLVQSPQDACFEILIVFSSRICAEIFGLCGFLLRALHVHEILPMPVNPACTCVCVWHRSAKSQKNGTGFQATCKNMIHVCMYLCKYIIPIS